MKKSIKHISLIAVLLAACLLFTACAGSNVHELKDKNGVVLYTDDAIDTSDTAAQKKLESYMSEKGLDAYQSSLGTDQIAMDIYAKGNVVVFRVDVKADVTDEQASALESVPLGSVSALDIKAARAETGVDNMVIVYVFVSKNGKVLNSKIIK